MSTINFNLLRPKPTVSFELITPEIAKELLETNPDDNRPLNPGAVKGFSAEMTNGNWGISPEGFAIDTNGKFIEGFTRANAIIDCGEPQWQVVVRNVPPESVSFINTGRPRSTSDRFSMAKFANPTKLATIVKSIISFQRKTREKFLFRANYSISSGNFISPKEELEFARDNKSELENIVELTSTWTKTFKKRLHPRYIATIYWAISTEGDGDLGKEFFERLTKGVKILETDPIYQLRAILDKNANDKKKLPASEKYNLTVKAWNLFLNKKEVKRLEYNRKKEKPVIPILSSKMLKNNLVAELETAD